MNSKIATGSDQKGVEYEEANNEMKSKLSGTINNTSEKEDSFLFPPLFLKAHQDLLKLYELIDDGKEPVANVRASAIRKEIEKQIDEETERLALDSYIANMEVKALAEYNELSKEWDEIELIKDPWTLHNQTYSQKEKCQSLIKEKHNVIEYLKEVLRKKDEMFLSQIEGQTAETNELLDRIEEQIISLKEVYYKQLESLEDIIDEEKQEIIESNKESWEKLMKDKDNVDKMFIEKLNDIVQMQTKPIMLAEKEHLEYKNRIRAKLDKYVNDLTVSIEILKSSCTLNIEKLEYNYDLLQKKQHDNDLIVQSLRKTITRAIKNLETIQKDMNERRSNINNQIYQYKKKLEKTSIQIISIDKRCTDLAQANSKKYFDIWKFMEKEVDLLIQEICYCDRIISEECLYIRWIPPDMKRQKPPSYLTALEQFELMKTKRNKMPISTIKKEPLPNSSFERLTKIILDGLKYSFGSNVESNSLSQQPINIQNLLGLDKILKCVGVNSVEDIKLLGKYFLPYVVCPECRLGVAACTEDQFDKSQMLPILHKCLIPDFKSENDSLLSLPTEKDALFIETQSQDGSNNETIIEFSDIGKHKLELASRAITSSDITDDKYDWETEKCCLNNLKVEDTTINKISDNEENLKICLNPEHHPFINPVNIIKGLGNFTKDLYKVRGRETNLSATDLLLEQRICPSRMLKLEEVTNYWQGFSNVVSHKKIQLWENIITCIQYYHKALKRRHDLNVEMTILYESNNDLTRLLEKYKED